MNFNLQMDNIFNQRRGELMENQRRRDVVVQQELNNAYNELQQLAHDNNIPLDVNVEVGGEIPAGHAFPINVIHAAGQFYIDILSIFIQRRRELPPLDAEELMAFDGAPAAFTHAYNRLVLGIGLNYRLAIEVTVLNMNDQRLPAHEDAAAWRALAVDGGGPVDNNNMPPHWQPAEPLPNNNMPHLIPAANMDEMPALIEDDNGVQPAFGWGAYPEEDVPEGDETSESDDSDAEDDNDSEDDGPLPAMVRAAPAAEDDYDDHFAAELAFRAAEDDNDPFDNDVEDDPMDDLDNDFNDTDLHQHHP